MSGGFDAGGAPGRVMDLRPGRAAASVETTRRNCPGCGHEKYKTLLFVRAEQFCSVNSTYRPDACEILGVSRDAAFPLVSCEQCGFVFAGLLPSARFLELVYEEVIDKDRGFFESVSPGWVAHQLELGSILLEGLARAFGREASFRILDFGCGNGSLAKALSGPRVECLGYESSRQRLAFLREQGVGALETVEAVRERGPYHAIVLSDVLEHLAEPGKTLVLCRDLLVPGGLLLVSVPEFSENRLRALRADVGGDGLRDRELNPWEHLNYFSASSLDEVLRARGFEEMETSRFVDIGLRPGLRGVRKWGNAVMALGRLARHLWAGEPRGTCRLVRRASTTGS